MTISTGADLFIDQVGALFWKKHPRCVAMDGRVVHIGFVSMNVCDN